MVYRQENIPSLLPMEKVVPLLRLQPSQNHLQLQPMPFRIMPFSVIDKMFLSPSPHREARLLTAEQEHSPPISMLTPLPITLLLPIITDAPAPSSLRLRSRLP